jgi:hypothetical protein
VVGQKSSVNPMLCDKVCPVLHCSEDPAIEMRGESWSQRRGEVISHLQSRVSNTRSARDHQDMYDKELEQNLWRIYERGLAPEVPSETLTTKSRLKQVATGGT